MGTASEKYKGKAKRIEGQVTRDKLRQTQGALEEIAAEFKGTVETIAKAAKQLARKTTKRLDELKR